jgi:hypothetical protein
MKRWGGILLVVPLLALAGQAADALSEERIAGIVRGTRVTHCDVTKRGGCAGTLTLQRAGGKGEAMTIQVPLGTPISRGDERVFLHALTGKTVLVTLSADRGARVARAIEVAEPNDLP